ncbi:hypothetical protein O3G_MSEX001247 [Manduca sexta]|uniref:Uncharacterized protein n=2 Tax=Manduca sexta TaxID=7130 RepID=A0A922CCA4_MANSE|nr:hypothetical protein O3G_MSEX001247 [Manduca sexta]
MQTIARTKSQELLLLEKIQAEAAAFYSYDTLPPADPPKDRKIVRTNLNSKYDRLSLEEMSGKKQPTTERRNSLDFKVLSLDEIRARKKEAIIHTTPITLNLSRKRKLSTQETITTSGNKIIKVVRSNSIVYKKVDHNAPPATTQTKVDHKPAEDVSRKRTLSELSDMCEIQEDELIDNCYEFKRVKIGEQTTKPRLIRNRLSSTKKSNEETKDVVDKTDDSDSEVQIVSVEVSEKHIDLSAEIEVIDVDTTRLGEPVDIVDLSEDLEESDVVSDLDIDIGKNVPDVVASCQKVSKLDNSDKNLINDIDALLNDEL